MPTNFKAKLKQFEDGYRAAKGDQEKRFSKPPDGKHRTILQRAEIGESKGGRLQVT